MSRFLFSLNEMRKEIEESMAVTSHEFVNVFSYYLLVSVLLDLYCSYLKGPTGTS